MSKLYYWLKQTETYKIDVAGRFVSMDIVRIPEVRPIKIITSQGETIVIPVLNIT